MRPELFLPPRPRRGERVVVRGLHGAGTSILVVPQPLDVFAEALLQAAARTVAELALGGADVPGALAVEMPEPAADLDARAGNEAAQEVRGVAEAPIAPAGYVED